LLCIWVCRWVPALLHVLSKLARAWGGVRPHRGITVIPTCGAAPAPVMPQVRRTWGRAESREKPQVRPSPLDLLGFWQPFQPIIATKTCRLYKRSREIIGEGGRPLDLSSGRR